MIKGDDGNAVLRERLRNMLQKGIKEMMLVIGNKQCLFAELFGIFADFAGFARPENNIDGII